MNTLELPSVKKLLNELYAKAKDDEKIFRTLDHGSGPLDDRKFAGQLNEAFIPVSPEVGRLLYQLVRARRPLLVVEFGASFGLSAIHIASALRDNGAGRLITTEQSPSKAARAREHFRQAGLSDLVELREGDAFETLKGISGVDFLLLDGWKALYLPLLRQLEPSLNPGCPILADDMKLMPEMLAPYVAYVRDPANGYVSTDLPIDDGLELSLR